MSTHVSTKTMVSDNGHADDDGARFVIVGHGRLALSVARKLTARAADVVMVTRDAKAKAQVESKLADLANGHGRYGRAPQVQVVAGDGDWNVLADPELDLSGAKCLLALADQREDNLRAALVASQTADCPTVLRAFHPSIAYGIETQRHGKAREHRGPDWRPFSMAHLAAPSFVAAALLEGDDRYVETMRLGDEYVAVCRLTVRDTSRLPQRRSTRLRGRSATELLAHAGCQVVAIRHVGGGWATETDLAGHRLEPGDEVVIGGPMANVFALVRNHSRRLECGLIGTEQVAATCDPETAAVAARAARPRGGKPGLVLEALRVRIRDAWVEASTLATRVLIGLIAVVTIVVIMFFPLHGVADGVYLWVITALGNPYQGAASSPHHAMVSAIGLLSGGVALGLWVSLMSAYFIERRMIETTQRRARRLRHHVVVVGLSDVGLRVAELLGKLGIRYAIVDTGDGDAARRSLELARDRPPILGGELENAMEQAGVDRAAAVIACSDDNLVNVEACLRAKRRPCAAPVRTVARIFDDGVAERAASMFGVDRSIAAVDVAAPAFVDAAVHGDGVREIELDGLSLSTLCRPVEDIAEYAQPADWDRRGVRLLAVWDGKEIKPPSGNVVPTEGKSVILAGPAKNIDRLAGSSRR